MAQTLIEKVLMWIFAILYGILTFANYARLSFKVGFKKFFSWKVIERPACLDDKTLGTHGYLHLEDVRLHYVASGPEDKPLMLFIHGFPQFWFAWRHQIKEFQKDYRVVAYDMRGYNESDKPKGLAPYTRQKLMAEVKQVILALGYKSCTLVAHDWGGGVAWSFGRLYPNYVDKLILLNAAPSPLLKRLFKTDAKQRKMSWYMYLFQLPYWPELSMKFMDYSTLAAVYKDSGMDQEEINAYLYVFSQPGALTPPINYYRASVRNIGDVVYDMDFAIPILLIWGCKDNALSAAIPNTVEKEIATITVRRIEDAGHFVQNSHPKDVNMIMREWLAE